MPQSESDFLVNIPLTEEEILMLTKSEKTSLSSTREQAKEVYAHFLANKDLLLSKKWEYNVTTQLEGESNVLEGPLD